MTEESKPQIAQINADVFANASICANLRHLRLRNHPMPETDKALRDLSAVVLAKVENLKKIGI